MAMPIVYAMRVPMAALACRTKTMARAPARHTSAPRPPGVSLNAPGFGASSAGGSGARLASSRHHLAGSLYTKLAPKQNEASHEDSRHQPQHQRRDDGANRRGRQRRCRGVHGTDIAVLELEDPASQAFDRILAASRHALAHDRSSAIVLGCGGMADLCHALQERLGVPVIDGVGAAVKLAEALVSLGLRTSKLGDYAPPLAKAYAGIAQPYSP